eukprot:3871300-Amphidinium_carterae.1
MTTKFGRSDAWTDAEWRKHFESGCRRDNKGCDGALRLWLQKPGYVDYVKSSYVDSGANEETERIKGADVNTRAALRRHVHDWSRTQSWADDHFHGKAGSLLQQKPGVPTSAASSGTSVVSMDDMALGEEAEDGDAGLLASKICVSKKLRETTEMYVQTNDESKTRTEIRKQRQSTQNNMTLKVGIYSKAFESK